MTQLGGADLVPEIRWAGRIVSSYKELLLGFLSSQVSSAPGLEAIEMLGPTTPELPLTFVFLLNSFPL